MKKKHTVPSLRTTMTLCLAASVLAGCATRPPRQPPAPVSLPPPPPDQMVVLPPPPPPPVVRPMPPPIATRAPRAVPTPSPAVNTPAAPRAGTSHTVKKGESLSTIAARNKISTRELAEYNRIADVNRVRAGQVILIPGGTTSTPAVKNSSPRAVPPSAPSIAGTSYVVQSGDSLSTVAARNGTTVAALKSANNLTSDRIRVGQTLKLPGASGGSVADSVVTGGTETTTPAPEATPASPRPTSTPMPLAGGTLLEPAPAATPKPTAVPDAAVGKAFPIVVEQGETLADIARSYIVPIEEIRKINNLPANAEVKAGDTLLIPPSVY
jgi:LysM repeat protein